MTTEPPPLRDHPVRFHVDHAETAARARKAKGRWVFVRGFGRLSHARLTAAHIRAARISPYRPAGGFETRIVHELECWPHRPEALYVRHVGGGA